MKGGFLTYSAKFNDSCDAYKAFITKCHINTLSQGTFGLTFTCKYKGHGKSPYTSMRDGIEKPVKTLVLKLGAISNDENEYEWSKIFKISTIKKKDFDNEIETQDTLVNDTLQYYSAICLTPVYSKIYEYNEEQELTHLLTQTDEIYIKHITDEIQQQMNLPTESRLWKYTIIAMEYGENMTTIVNSLKINKTRIYAALFLKVFELFLLGYIHTDLHDSNAMIMYDKKLRVYRVWLIDMARVFAITNLDIIANNSLINDFVNKYNDVYQKDVLANLGYDNCRTILNGIYNGSFFKTNWSWFNWYQTVDEMRILSNFPDLFSWMVNEFTPDVYLEMIVCANKEMERRAQFSNEVVISRDRNSYKSKKSQIHMIRRDDIPIPIKKNSKYKKRNQPIVRK
jgi:hypothetical protein